METSASASAPGVEEEALDCGLAAGGSGGFSSSIESAVDVRICEYVWD